MKHTDPVMHEVWRAKAVNAKKHETLSAYMAYLRKQGKLQHAAGRIAAPTNARPVKRVSRGLV